MKTTPPSYFERAVNYNKAQGDLDEACRHIARVYKLTDYEWIALFSHIIQRLVSDENIRDWNGEIS